MVTTPAPARLKPDSRPIAYGAVALAAAIYLGAFATSFFGQAALAAHMNIPSALQYVVPAVVDLALVLFTMATLVRKSRGETTLWTNLATGFWTLVSIAANILHVIVPAGGNWSLGVIVGAGLSALMPVAALGASLVIENVLIEPARKVQEPLTGAKVHERPASLSGRQERSEPLPAKPVPTSSSVLQERTRLTAVPDLIEPTAPAVSGRVKEAGAAAKDVPAASSKVPGSDSLTAVRNDGSSWEGMSKEARAECVETLKAEGLSNPEIATRMETSLSSVKRSASDLKALRPAA